ncbi:MAG: hypothetical protein ACREKN_04320 [Longimicrobiaceae bacterium]
MKSVLAGVTAGVLLAGAAHGYGPQVNRLLVTHALEQAVVASTGGGGRVLPATVDTPVSEESRDAFLRWLYDGVVELSDLRLRTEFYARYPAPDDFLERGFREFLMTDPETRLLGVDRAPGGRGDSIPPTFLELVGRGSVYPALDRRNSDRVFRGTDGRPIPGPGGDTVPFDPAVLNTGPLAGPGSETHARLALIPGSKSGDLDVLDDRPWAFARPFAFGDSVHTFAARNVQLYTDLAVLAATSALAGSDALAAVFAGNALHYLAHAGNPMNTLQVGSAAIHRPPARQLWLRRLRTLFGLLGDGRSLDRSALDRAAVYRRAGEAVVGVGLSRPERSEEAAALRQLRRGDLRFQSALEARAGQGEWGRRLALELARAGSRDAAASFDALAEAGAERLREATPGQLASLSDEQIVRRYLPGFAGRESSRARSRFWRVHAAALGRLHAGFEVWWSRFNRVAGAAAGDGSTVRGEALSRLVSRQLAYLAEADARRARYLVEERREGP